LPQTITSQKLIKSLKSLGFVERARKGSHIILEHPGYKQRVALPAVSPKKQLSQAVISTISKVITEAGVISKEDLEALIKK
jgi:predicted RNA binding protein YcfA (HicA-like mRNA interferase family)